MVSPERFFTGMVSLSTVVSAATSQISNISKLSAFSKHEKSLLLHENVNFNFYQIYAILRNDCRLCYMKVCCGGQGFLFKTYHTNFLFTFRIVNQRRVLNNLRTTLESIFSLSPKYITTNGQSNQNRLPFFKFKYAIP